MKNDALLRVLLWVFGLPIGALLALFFAYAIGTGFDNLFIADGGRHEGTMGELIGVLFFFVSMVGLVIGLIVANREIERGRRLW